MEEEVSLLIYRIMKDALIKNGSIDDDVKKQIENILNGGTYEQDHRNRLGNYNFMRFSDGQR